MGYEFLEIKMRNGLLYHLIDSGHCNLKRSLPRSPTDIRRVNEKQYCGEICRSWTVEYIPCKLIAIEKQEMSTG